MAASVNSSCAPRGPRNRRRPSLRMRLRWANNISTRFRSRQDCSNATVLGEHAGNVAGIFMNAARDLAGRFLGAASHFERAYVAIRFAGPIQPLIIIHDLAGRGEGFECWTDVDVTRLVEGEVLAREGAVVSAWTCR